MPPRKHITTAEELDNINQRIASSLRTAIRQSGEPFSSVAAWAGVSDDSVRNWIRDDGKAQKIPLGRALLLIRRGRGPVRAMLRECIKQVMEVTSPAADQASE